MSDEMNREPLVDETGAATRRNLLRLGALGVPAIVTMSPAFANNTGAVSIMKCQIPVPDSANVGKWIKNDGTLVASGTSNSFPGPSRPYTGQEILTMSRPSITMTNGQSLSQTAFNAHVEYIKKLQRGTQGFTCFASIANRRIL
jgi:hypothetical protein